MVHAVVGVASNNRGVAQSGSASALGAEGREFESHRPDHFTSVQSEMVEFNCMINSCATIDTQKIINLWSEREFR